MDLNIAKLSNSVAQTGSVRDDASIEVLKRAQDIQASTAAQLIDAVKAPPTIQNLPTHLGNTINTKA